MGGCGIIPSRFSRCNMELIHCLIYFALLGTVTFFTGRLTPKSWIDPERFPFNSFEWEKNGTVYNRLRIKSWQNLLPDMSRIQKKLIPAKKMLSSDADWISTMIRETCIAEAVHSFLMIAGFGCISIWEGPGGAAVSILYFIVNLVYVIIQRYNRPGLKKLLRLPGRTPEPSAAVKSLDGMKY